MNSEGKRKVGQRLVFTAIALCFSLASCVANTSLEFHQPTKLKRFQMSATPLVGAWEGSLVKCFTLGFPADGPVDVKIELYRNEELMGEEERSMGWGNFKLEPKFQPSSGFGAYHCRFSWTGSHANEVLGSIEVRKFGDTAAGGRTTFHAVPITTPRSSH